MFQQIPWGAGSVFALCAGIWLLLSVDLFTSILWFAYPPGWPLLLLPALWGWCPSSSSLSPSALFPPSSSIIALDSAITPCGCFLGGSPFLLTSPLGAPSFPPRLRSSGVASLVLPLALWVSWPATALPGCCDARVLAPLSPILDLPPPLSPLGSDSLRTSFPDGFSSLLDLSFLPPRLRSNGTVPPFSLSALPLALLITETPFFGVTGVRVPLGPAAGGLGEPIWVVRLGRGGPVCGWSRPPAVLSWVLSLRVDWCTVNFYLPATS